MNPPKKQKPVAPGRHPLNASSNHSHSFDIEQAFANAIRNHQSGNLQQAQKIYKEILSINPNHAETLNAQAILACQQGQHAAAVILFQKAIHENPTKDAYHYNLGNALKDLGRSDDAVPCYRQALLLEPDHTEALNNLGTILHNQGRFDEAISSYKEALRITPDYAEALYNLAVTLQSVNRLKDAVLCYQKALRTKEDFPEVYSRLGSIFHEQGKIDAAIACFQQALQISPEYAIAHGNLASALTRIGNLNGAMDSCRRALGIDADLPEVYMLLTTLLFITRDWEHFDEVTEAILTNPKLSEQNRNWLNIQRALQAWLTGNLARCTQYLQASSSIQRTQPGDIYGKSRLAFYCLLKRLIDSRAKSPHLYVAEKSPSAYMLGDSHCLSFANLPVRIGKKTFTVAAGLAIGCKAYHLSQKEHNQYKEELLRNIASIPDDSTVILSFGEIDCRTGEGIYPAWMKKFQHLSLEEMVRNTVDGYLGFISEVTKGRKFRLMLLGVPAPMRSTVNMLTAEEIPPYVSIPRLWNKYLQNATLQNGWTFLDTYTLTCDKQGFSHGRYHIDDHHLYPAALASLVSEHAIPPYLPD